MKEKLFTEASLIENLQRRYLLLKDLRGQENLSLITKESIHNRIQEIFGQIESWGVDLSSAQTAHPLLGLFDLMANVYTATVGGETIACLIEYQKYSKVGFQPRRRFTLYRMGWSGKPEIAPVRVDLIEFTDRKEALGL